MRSNDPDDCSLPQIFSQHNKPKKVFRQRGRLQKMGEVPRVPENQLRFEESF
jgi:hypothetical protein